MRLLILGPETEALAQRVREYAERPENWFRPGPSSEWHKLEGSGLRPGSKPEHRVTLPMGFKCVFSWTVAEKLDGSPIVMRDLSVAVDGATPNPISVFAIAEFFGFTKRTKEMNQSMPHPAWMIGFDRCQNPCVTVMEEAPAKP